MDKEEANRMVASVKHWHHAFEIYPGVRTPGTYDPEFLWDKLALPLDLKSARVLDIGASDGFFTRAIARAGADVVAIDYRAKDQHGFGVMERLNPNLAIDYRVANIYQLDPAELGRFDIILFLGVLYHLPDMIRALHLIRSCCRDTMYLETHSDNTFSPSVPAARYYRDDTLAGDGTNFWSPNRLCVIDMLHDCGFDVSRDECFGDRLFCSAQVADMSASRAGKLALGYGKMGH